MSKGIEKLGVVVGGFMEPFEVQKFDGEPTLEFIRAAVSGAYGFGGLLFFAGVVKIANSAPELLEPFAQEVIRTVNETCLPVTAVAAGLFALLHLNMARSDSG